MTIKELMEYIADLNLPEDAEVLIEFPETTHTEIVRLCGEEREVIDTFAAGSDGARLIILHHY